MLAAKGMAALPPGSAGTARASPPCITPIRELLQQGQAQPAAAGADPALEGAHGGCAGDDAEYRARVRAEVEEEHREEHRQALVIKIKQVG